MGGVEMKRYLVCLTVLSLLLITAPATEAKELFKSMPKQEESKPKDCRACEEGLSFKQKDGSEVIIAPNGLFINGDLQSVGAHCVITSVGDIECWDEPYVKACGQTKKIELNGNPYLPAKPENPDIEICDETGACEGSACKEWDVPQPHLEISLSDFDAETFQYLFSLMNSVRQEMNEWLSNKCDFSGCTANVSKNEAAIHIELIDNTGGCNLPPGQEACVIHHLAAEGEVGWFEENTCNNAIEDCLENLIDEAQDVDDHCPDCSWNYNIENTEVECKFVDGDAEATCSMDMEFCCVDKANHGYNYEVWVEGEACYECVETELTGDGDILIE